MNAALLKATEFIKKKNQNKKARIAIILGSGLGTFSETLNIKSAISYSEIPFFPRSTVEGHRGRLLLAEMSGVLFYVLEGRFHYYEGKSLQDVTFPIRVLKKLEVEILIVTNASGSLNKNFKRGEFMLIKDHINLIGDNPLRGKNWDDWGPRFPNLTTAYEPKLRNTAKRIAKKMKVKLHEGVYAAISGPSYETPAEAKMLQIMGADAVGMSTVPEVIVAAHQGTRVCGVSCLTNDAASFSHKGATHEEVLKVMKEGSKKLSQFLHAFIIEIANE